MWVHFHSYSEEFIDIDKDGWNPDQEPHKYSSGFSHNMLELGVRLQALGHTSTFGPNIPAASDLTCIFKDELDIANFNLKKCWNLMKNTTVHIRSDLGIRSILQFPTQLTIVPNRQMENRVRHKYLPPLPQRGLIKSQRKLCDSITNLSIKCNPENIPEWLLKMKEDLVLEKEGLNLVIDSPSKTDGNDHSWNDFSDVDVSLILRNKKNPSEAKPPTRLLNAWLAGTIPFVSPEIAYLEEISDGENAFIVHDPSEIIGLVKKLNSDSQYLEMIRTNIEKISATINVNKIVEQYEKEFLRLILDREKFNFTTRVIYLLRAYSMHRLYRLHPRMKSVKILNYWFKIRVNGFTQ
jgi:hypothetical protein